ncbi:hypothetical protein [Actinoplanes sp. HUAS TT8]|uniref:hypothetical protein n=1 Tax=Actinoplanes sp. HUAS TT8 TaxID=3447453 RepID=UPI003F5241EB
MSYISDDGHHQGWIAPVFLDGSLGISVTDAIVTVGYGPDGAYLDPADQQERPDTEVTGWMMVCSKPAPYREWPALTWRGSLWSRVRTPAEQDLTARRVCLSDDYNAYWEPAAMKATAEQEWKRHIASGGVCGNSWNEGRPDRPH